MSLTVRASYLVGELETEHLIMLLLAPHEADDLDSPLGRIQEGIHTRASPPGASGMVLLRSHPNLLLCAFRCLAPTDNQNRGVLKHLERVISVVCGHFPSIDVYVPGNPDTIKNFKNRLYYLVMDVDFQLEHHARLCL